MKNLTENGVTAHRGNSAEFPENTVASFKSGIDAGADWLELDVRKSKDGELFVIHDRSSERVSGKDLIISESCSQDILKADAAFAFRRDKHKTLTEAPFAGIPLLREVVELVMSCGKCRVSIQPKDNSVHDILALVRDMRAEKYAGFNDGDLNKMAAVKKFDSSIPVFWDRCGSDIDSDIPAALKHGFETVVMHIPDVTPEKIKKLHSAGLKAGAWTVNSPDSMRQLLSWGADRIYTDNPKLLIKIRGPVHAGD
jgi:glycerophosphoryl diester phosphodiesterase